MIGSVCTHEAYRQRGYASALIADALNKMKRDGMDFVMISGDRGLYRRFGCFKSGIVYLYNDASLFTDLGFEEKDFEVIICNNNHIKDIAAVYQKEPVRFWRSLEDFKILTKFFITPPKYEGLQARIYLATINNEPLAYVAAFSLTKIKFLKICEYAGSRISVSNLIAHILKSEQSRSIELTVPFQDADLIRLLGRCGLRKQSINSEASMLILNPESFFEKAKSYLAERAGVEVTSEINVEAYDDRVKFSIKGDSLVLEPSDFTSLFFGSPEKERNREKIKPIMNLLGEALPMPTPAYGLNYI
jgi:predicted acetyltransferase